MKNIFQNKIEQIKNNTNILQNILAQVKKRKRLFEKVLKKIAKMQNLSQNEWNRRNAWPITRWTWANHKNK